jgi:hypothetical protein
VTICAVSAGQGLVAWEWWYNSTSKDLGLRVSSIIAEDSGLGETASVFGVQCY